MPKIYTPVIVDGRYCRTDSTGTRQATRQATGDELNLYALLMLPHHRPNYLLAARMGIHPTRLSEYARGRRPIPDRTLIRMCKILAVDAYEILRPFPGPPEFLKLSRTRQ